MSSSTHPIIILSGSNVEDAFSSTNTHDYTPALPDYFPASPGNTFFDPLKDLSKDLLASLTISPFHDDSYMKVMQAYNATNNESPIPLPRAPIAPPTILPLSLVSHKIHLERHEEQIKTILNHLDELPLERNEHIEDKIKGLDQIRHDDEIVLARVRISTLEMLIEDIQIRHRSDMKSLLDTIHELKNQLKNHKGGPPDYYTRSLSFTAFVTMALLLPGFLEPLYPDMINAQDIEHIIPPTPPRDTEPPVESPISLSPSLSVGSSSPIRMAPKRTSTSAAPTMTHAAIRKLVVDSVAAALEAQAATMTNTDNTTRNTRQRETPIARKCSYKEFMNCQPFNFKGTEGAVSLIRWFERAESVFLRSNCTEDCKVKFATGTLTEEALSWWNSFAQPIGIEEAYKIPWSEFKKLLIKKYCPQTEVKKIKDEFYNLTVKGNDLKTYVGRFQELAVLCPTMVPNSDKLIEVFIGGLPRSVEGNVTASKPQTLEEAITMTQRLMD
ncbi:reverse transcriptase domain-containing protein [Tanacetum coccineum]